MNLSLIAHNICKLESLGHWDYNSKKHNPNWIWVIIVRFNIRIVELNSDMTISLICMHGLNAFIFTYNCSPKVSIRRRIQFYQSESKDRYHLEQKFLGKCVEHLFPKTLHLNYGHVQLHLHLMSNQLFCLLARLPLTQRACDHHND